MDYVTPVSIALIVLVAAVGAWFWLRRTLRTRLSVIRQIHADPNVSEWLVLFGWTNKIVYIPALLVTLLAAALTLAQENLAGALYVSYVLVGRIWLAAVVLNVIIEEWRFGFKTLLAVAVAAGALAWLASRGAMHPVFSLLASVEVSMSGAAYAVLAALGVVVIFASWVRGLFHFVAITPGYVLVRRGFSKATAQFPTADCTVTIDTSDLPKRLLGFGRVVITFKDPSQSPIKLLVGRVGGKAARLKAVRRTMERDAVVAARPAESEPPAPAKS